MAMFSTARATALHFGGTLSARHIQVSDPA